MDNGLPESVESDLLGAAVAAPLPRWVFLHEIARRKNVGVICSVIGNAKGKRIKAADGL